MAAGMVAVETRIDPFTLVSRKRNGLMTLDVLNSKDVNDTVIPSALQITVPLAVTQ